MKFVKPFASSPRHRLLLTPCVVLSSPAIILAVSLTLSASKTPSFVEISGWVTFFVELRPSSARQSRRRNSVSVGNPPRNNHSVITHDHRHRCRRGQQLLLARQARVCNPTQPNPPPPTPLKKSNMSITATGQLRQRRASINRSISQ